MSSLNRRGFFGTLIAAFASRWRPAPKRMIDRETGIAIQFAQEFKSEPIDPDQLSRYAQLFAANIHRIAHERAFLTFGDAHGLRDGDVVTCSSELVAMGLPARFIAREVKRDA